MKCKNKECGYEHLVTLGSCNDPDGFRHDRYCEKCDTAFVCHKSGLVKMDEKMRDEIETDLQAVVAANRVRRREEQIVSRQPILKQALNAIGEINAGIFKCIGEQNFYCGLEVLTNGDEVLVRFGNYPLWSSIDDDRPWDASGYLWESGSTEWQLPLEKHLRNELTKFLEVLKKISVRG